MSQELMRLADLLIEVDERNPPDSAEVFSVSESRGIVPQRELFTKKIATDDRSKYRRIQYGDVVFNPYLLWNGAAGVCFHRAIGCVSPVYPVLRPKYQGTERFLHYLLRSLRFKSAVNAISTGSVTRRRTAPLDKILGLAFRLPEISNQRVISSLLQAVDEKIELNQRMNATLEQLARSLFQSWFVDFDPVRAKLDGHQPRTVDEATAALFPANFQASRTGPIPTGWISTTLGEGCNKGGGSIQTGPFGTQLHASDYVEEGVPSIMPSNLRDNRIETSSIARVRERDADRLSVYRVRVGDVVYSRRGDVERRSLIRSAEDGWLCGTGCLRVRFGALGLNPHFGAAYLGSSESRAWVVRHAVGATMPNLNTSILGALPMVVPPSSIQTKFAEIIGPWDELGTNILEQSRTLTILRETLLPKLLTGALRFPEAMELVGANA